MPYLDPNAGKLREAQSSDAVEDMAASANLTAVPGAFADEAAVKAYLDTLVPEVEARLDAIEAKLNELLGALRTAGLIQA